MAGYIGPIPVPQATQSRETFTATASQNSFGTAGYQVGYLDVFMNGVKLAPADFTATNGSDVVLASGAAVNDIIEVVSYSAFEVLNQNFTGTTVVDNLTVGGNLTVDGTTTTINSTTLNVDDINITVASGAADSAAANGAGLTVDGAGATFNYSHSGTKWTMNKPLDVGGAVTADGLNITTATSSAATLENTGNSGTTFNFDANRSNVNGWLGSNAYKWDGTLVAQISGATGSDTTNKDDGTLLFYTAAAGTILARQKISNNGDISFYEDTGTTPKMVWKSSDEQLAITNDFDSTALKITKGNNSGNALEIFNSGSSRSLQIDHNVDNSGTVDDIVRIRSNGTTVFEIENSGNVGIGAVPESWLSAYTALQIGDAGSVVGSSDNSFVAVGANAYLDSTNSRYEYINSDYASQYYQVDGTHVWRTAASGSADAAISWSEAMRIDSSQRVLIGTNTSFADANSDDLQISGSGDTGMIIKSGTSSYGSIYFGDGTSGDARNEGIVRYSHSNNSMELWTSASRKLSINTSGDVTIETGNLVIGTAGKGIDFSATAGTGTSELLDDYEEGVWLPSIEFASAGSTATVASSAYTTGSYTKVGDIVTVEFNISGITFGNGTGNLRMALPFTHVGIAAYPGKNQASSGYTVAADTASGYSGVLKVYGVGPLNLMYDSGTSWAFITNSNASTISPNSINGQFTYHTNQ